MNDFEKKMAAYEQCASTFNPAEHRILKYDDIATMYEHAILDSIGPKGMNLSPASAYEHFEIPLEALERIKRDEPSGLHICELEHIARTVGVFVSVRMAPYQAEVGNLPGGGYSYLARVDSPSWSIYDTTGTGPYGTMLTRH